MSFLSTFSGYWVYEVKCPHFLMVCNLRRWIPKGCQLIFALGLSFSQEAEEITTNSEYFKIWSSVCVQLQFDPKFNKLWWDKFVYNHFKWKESAKIHFFCYISFSKSFFLIYCFQGAKSLLNCVFQKYYTFYENLSLISGFSNLQYNWYV